MGLTPEEVKAVMEEQIGSVAQFHNTPHDGGPGWAHENAKWRMVITTCEAVAKTFQAELDNVSEREALLSHNVEELTEEMKEWDAIDDSIEWDGMPAPNTGGSNVIWEPTYYEFVIKRYDGTEGLRTFKSMYEFMVFCEAVDEIGSLVIAKDSKGRWSLWVK